MKNISYLLICFFISTTLYGQNYNGKIVNLAYQDLLNYPFITGYKGLAKGKRKGVTLEILDIISNKLNIKFKFTRAPWKRILLLQEQNKVDGVFHMSFLKSRLAYSHFPLTVGNTIDVKKKIMSNTYSFYAKKGKNVLWNGKKLENSSNRVGAILGYSIVSDLKAMDLNVYEVYGNKKLFDLLLSGRVDAIAHLENQANNFLNNNQTYQEKITKIDNPLRQKNYYLTFSFEFYKKNKNLAENIWRELKNINDSNIRKKIMQNYLP